jgi:hypothetical protein
VADDAVVEGGDVRQGPKRRRRGSERVREIGYARIGREGTGVHVAYAVVVARRLGPDRDGGARTQRRQRSRSSPVSKSHCATGFRWAG